MRTHSSILLVVLLTSGLALHTHSVHAQQKAFPEAEGYGALVTGGRGGTVYHVTNLNDSGAGSLRDAVSQSNRIVVFDTSGVITLSSALVVKSNITIAGQTAPGDGITIYNSYVSLSNVSNVIMRDIRIHAGINSPSGAKALSATDCTNLIFDHVSVEWGRWDNTGLTKDKVGAGMATFQNCIIGEPIDPQYFGGLFENPEGVTFSHNLFIDNWSRNPKVKGTIQYINNVVYNWGIVGLCGGHSGAVHNLDCIGNYFIAGPSSTSDNQYTGEYTATDHVYQTGNVKDLDKNGVLDGVAAVPSDFYQSTTYPGPTFFDAPLCNDIIPIPVPVTIDSAEMAYAKVLAGAGASLVRDPVDTRMIDQLTSLGTLGYARVSQESDVGGQPSMTVVTRPANYDTDNDGIPNTWEMTHGLNPIDPTDATSKTNPLGYAYIEQYINDIAVNHAACTWSSNGGSWGAAANWSAAVPTWDDIAYVVGDGTGAPGLVNITQAGAACFHLYIGGNGSSTADKVAVNGGTLTVNDTIYLGDQNNGTLEINSGSVRAWNIVLGNTVGITTYTGSLVLNPAGTLQAYQIVLGGGTPGNWTSGGAFTWAGGTLQAIGTLKFAVPATITPAGAWIHSNGFNCTISGVLSGDGGLTKIGSGTVLLTAANSYAGTTTLINDTLATAGSAGVSVIPGSVSLGNGSYEVWLKPGAANQFGPNSVITWNNYAKNAKFQLSGNSQTVAGLQSATVNSLSIIQNAESETYGAAVLTIDAAGDYSFYGIIQDKSSGSAGSLSLVKKGAGTQTLRNRTAQTGIAYTGATTIQAGTLVLNLSGATAANFASNIINDATLGLDGSWTLSKAISGSGSLLKQGSGTVTLSGAAAYAGDTTITAGRLQLNGSSYTLHSISGDGTLGVGDGAASSSLTAESIQVGALSIGAGSKIVIAPLTGDSSLTPVPEPSTIALLIAAGWAVWFYCVIFRRRHA
jgi:autotransporter-associated beta strand protein